jgi:hypothetical protein
VKINLCCPFIRIVTINSVSNLFSNNVNNILSRIMTVFVTLPGNFVLVIGLIRLSEVRWKDFGEITTQNGNAF